MVKTIKSIHQRVRTSQLFCLLETVQVVQQHTGYWINVYMGWMDYMHVCMYYIDGFCTCFVMKRNCTHAFFHFVGFCLVVRRILAAKDLIICNTFLSINQIGSECSSSPLLSRLPVFFQPASCIFHHHFCSG